MDHQVPNRTRLAVLMLAMALLGSPAAWGEPKVKIAVMELKGERGIDKGLMKLLNELLLTEFGRTGKYEVIGGSDIVTMLQHKQQMQMLACDDVSCLAELGGALGAELLVQANIGRVGSFYLLNVKIINTRTTKVEGRVSYRVEGLEDQLIRAITSSVLELTQGKQPSQNGTISSGLLAEPLTSKAAGARDPYLLWGHVSLWTGVGLMAFGGVAAGVSAGAADDYQAGDLDAEETSRTWARMMYAGLGMGTALIATGLVLWLVAPDQAPSGHTALLPTGDGNGLVFSIGGSW